MEERLTAAGEPHRARAGLFEFGSELLEARQWKLVRTADGRSGAEEAVDVAAVGRIDLDVIRPAVGRAVAHPAHDAGLLIVG